MKTFKVIFFILTIQFSFGQNLFENSKFSMQVFYGVKVMDYNSIPRPYLDKANVSIKNTNNLGLKFTYFFHNRLILGLNFNYNSISMRNKKEIIDFDNDDGWYTYYYSPENGFARSSKLSVLFQLDYHIIQKSKFDWSFSFGFGTSYYKYNSNVNKETAYAKLDEVYDFPEDEVEFNGGYGNFQYPINEKVTSFLIPNVRLFLGSNLFFALTPKLGLNLEMGIGHYNFAGGIFYKFN